MCESHLMPPRKYIRNHKVSGSNEVSDSRLHKDPRRELLVEGFKNTHCHMNV